MEYSFLIIWTNNAILNIHLKGLNVHFYLMHLELSGLNPKDWILVLNSLERLLLYMNYKFQRFS